MACDVLPVVKFVPGYSNLAPSADETCVAVVITEAAELLVAECLMGDKHGSVAGMGFEACASARLLIPGHRSAVERA